MPVWRLMKSWPSAEAQRQAEWVALMMASAATTASLLGVTPAAIVAQAALESAWGKATVGKCNLFGIKADEGWTGPRVLSWTREVVMGHYITIQSWFRDYATFQQSIEDHFSFLQKNGRYQDIITTANKTDAKYFQMLQADGYATDPDYAAKLVAVERDLQTYYLAFMKPIGEGTTNHQPRRVLMQGCTGADVAEMQEKLGMTADSVFGPMTRQRVTDWQREHNLSSDGIAGPITLKSLGLN